VEHFWEIKSGDSGWEIKSETAQSAFLLSLGLFVLVFRSSVLNCGVFVVRFFLLIAASTPSTSLPFDATSKPKYTRVHTCARKHLFIHYGVVTFHMSSYLGQPFEPLPSVVRPSRSSMVATTTATTTTNSNTMSGAASSSPAAVTFAPPPLLSDAGRQGKSAASVEFENNGDCGEAEARDTKEALNAGAEECNVTKPKDSDTDQGENDKSGDDKGDDGKDPKDKDEAPTKATTNDEDHARSSDSSGVCTVSMHNAAAQLEKQLTEIATQYWASTEMYLLRIHKVQESLLAAHQEASASFCEFEQLSASFEESFKQQGAQEGRCLWLKERDYLVKLRQLEKASHQFVEAIAEACAEVDGAERKRCSGIRVFLNGHVLRWNALNKALFWNFPGIQHQDDNDEMVPAEGHTVARTRMRTGGAADVESAFIDDLETAVRMQLGVIKSMKLSPSDDPSHNTIEVVLPASATTEAKAGRIEAGVNDADPPKDEEPASFLKLVEECCEAFRTNELSTAIPSAISSSLVSRKGLLEQRHSRLRKVEWRTVFAVLTVDQHLHFFDLQALQSSNLKTALMGGGGAELDAAATALLDGTEIQPLKSIFLESMKVLFAPKTHPTAFDILTDKELAQAQASGHRKNSGSMSSWLSLGGQKKSPKVTLRAPREESMVDWVVSLSSEIRKASRV
jgi:hypothetical protein